MRCPNCGNENPPDYMFCDECGARLGGDTDQAATSTSTTSPDEQAVPAIPGDGPESYPGAAPLPGVQPYVSPGFSASSSAEESAPQAEGALSADGDGGLVPEPANPDTTIAGRGPADEPTPPPVTEDTIAAPSWETAGATPSATATEDEGAMPDVVPVEGEAPALDTAAASEAAEEAEPAAAAPDFTPAPDTATAAPVAEAGTATAGAAGMAPMPDMAGAPAATTTTSTGGGNDWASRALLQLDTAQSSLASGDWASFASGMSALRSTLQEAAQAAPSTGAAMAGAASAPAPYMGAGATTAEPAPAAYEPAVEGGGYDSSMDGAAMGAGAGAAAAIPDTVSGPMAGTGAGPARLVVISTGAELPLPEQEEITVGREDPSSGIFPDVDLTPYGGEDGGVSRRHARLLHIAGDYFVEDLQSTNYTKLDGQRLPAHVRERLEDGARLDFGRVAVIFRRS
jgi:hypothetical protein